MKKSAPNLPGLNPVMLLAIYAALALSPLAIASALSLPPRSFLNEFSSALAMLGFSMLLLEFVLSGRFVSISGRIGIDVTMRLHQLMARTVIAFALVHPFLYTTPIGYQLPWDSSGQYSLGIGLWSLLSGIFAWLMLAILVLWALFQREMGTRYETWRLCHGIGAGMIALLTLHHAIDAGRYSSQTPLIIFWGLMVAVAMLTLLHVYLIRPLLQLRHPYTVTSLRKVAFRTWELTIEPEHGKALDFLPGQFVWLTLKCTPFAIIEHPFSISSAPAERPRIGFTIKEMGDFTNNIGRIPIGSCAYIDGPHGHLVLGARSGNGLAFIAGGSGLAPIMSMLRQLRAEHDPRPMKLIYGNRVVDQILYRTELEAISKDLNLSIEYILSDPPADWQGRTGLLDIHGLAECLDSGDCAQWLYVVCGPAAMIDSVEHSLQQLGVPRRQMLSEKFSQM